MSQGKSALGAFRLIAASLSLAIATIWTATGTEYYVNPDAALASDTYDGRAEVWEGGTHGPKLTLTNVMSVANSSGDIVYAAEGHYNVGAARATATSRTLNRVVIPAGVSLIASGSRDKTFIEGEDAPLANQFSGGYGCGEDAVRCVYMNTGSKLRGFTICNGRVGARSTTEEGSECGAGIICRERDKYDDYLVADCMISNNVGVTDAVVKGGSYYRCVFQSNRNVYYGGVSYVAMFNCVLRDLPGQYAIHVPKVMVNCTVGNDCGYLPVRNNSLTDLKNAYNCIFVTSRTDKNMRGMCLHNCLVSEPNEGCELVDGSRVVAYKDLKLDADLCPAKDSMVVDGGSNEFYTATSHQPSSAFFADEGAKDVAGNARVMNGRIDIGAFEYDWRADFTEDLDCERAAVVAAGPGVVEKSDKRLSIGAGSALDVDWTAPAAGMNEYSLSVQVKGDAILYGYANGGSDPAFAIGEGSGLTVAVVKAEGATVRLRLVCEGANGAAEVSRFRDQTVVSIVAPGGGLKVEGVPFGETVVPPGESLEFTVRRDTNSLHLCEGIRVGSEMGVRYFAFDDYPAGWTHTVASRADECEIVPVYCERQSFFVSPDGDDANCGFLPTMAVRTLAAALTKPGLAPGDTVCLKPGRYDSGTMRDGTEKTLTRGILKPGVNLTGLGERPEDVVILGAQAPEDKRVPNTYGCGEDAVRCLMLKGTNVVRNVMLAEGRIYYCTNSTSQDANASASGKYAGVYASGDDNFVIGCTFSNCVGYVESLAGDVSHHIATSDTAHALWLARCTFVDNRALWYALIQYANLYECLTIRNVGTYLVHNCPLLVNCTLTEDGQRGTCGTAYRYSRSEEGRARVYNSVIGSTHTATAAQFYRSLFPNPSCCRDLPSFKFILDGTRTNGVHLAYHRGTYVPSQRSDAFNTGNNDYLSIVPALIGSPKTDLYGKPRIAYDAVDIGPAELQESGIVLIVR